MNTGIPYEKLTKTIFENMLRRQDVNNLEVQHNAHIKGRTVEHQIDVYWRFEVGGVEYKTIVQCKDWKNPVSQTELQVFSDVLSDIPGQPRGIVVTRIGYQAGARAIAAAKGIVLYTLREPTTDDDWAGLARTIIANIRFVIPRGDKPNIEIDQAWLSTQHQRLGLQSTESIAYSMGGMEDEIWLYREDGEPIQTLQDIKKFLLANLSGVVMPRRARLDFTEPTYMLNLSDSRLPRVKIAAISYEVSQTIDNMRIELKADNITSYILMDVLSESKTVIDRELQMRLPPAS